MTSEPVDEDDAARDRISKSYDKGGGGVRGPKMLDILDSRAWRVRQDGDSFLVHGGHCDLSYCTVA